MFIKKLSVICVALESKIQTFKISLGCRDLLSEFRSTLTEENIKKPLVMLIDGVDLVRDGKAQLSSDWMPLEIPKVSKRLVDAAARFQRVTNISFPSQGVCLVISLTSKTALLQTLTKKKSALLFTLGPLTMPERREIVQQGLDTFGKKLSDSAFNNQVLSCFHLNSVFL